MLTQLDRSVRGRRASRSRRPSRPALEALEGRIVPSWSGSPPFFITPPAGAVAVGLNSQGDSAGDAAISSNEVDFYTFVAPVGGTYRIAAITPASDANPIVGLYNAAGVRLAFNADVSPGNPDSLLSVTLAAGNRYSFGITNEAGTPGGSYIWVIDGPALGLVDDGFEENDNIAQSASLGTPASTLSIGGLVMADAADWFNVTIASTGTTANYIASSFPNAQGNLDLELYNGVGQVLRSSYTTNDVEVVSLNLLPPGTYYLRIFGARAETNPGYTLTIVPPAVPVIPAVPTGAFDIALRFSGLSASQQAIFDRAALRWEQVIVGDLPNASFQGVPVDDVLIDARAATIDGVGGVLGQAGPDSLRSGSALPIHGSMEFDTADLATMEANGSLFDVILHEMGHVLGFGTIWQTLGLITGAGTTNPRFTGSRAIAEYNALFRTTASGVPVEGRPSPAGSRDGHWRESAFGNELMTPYISGTPNPISRVTVAAFADMGYTVNLAAAGAYTPLSMSTASVSASTQQAGAALVWIDPVEGTTRKAKQAAIDKMLAMAAT